MAGSPAILHVGEEPLCSGLGFPVMDQRPPLLNGSRQVPEESGLPSLTHPWALGDNFLLLFSYSVASNTL